MNPTQVKEPLTSWTIYNFLKYKFGEKNKNKFSFDLNFHGKFKNKNRIFDEKPETTLN